MYTPQVLPGTEASSQQDSNVHYPATWGSPTQAPMILAEELCKSRGTCQFPGLSGLALCSVSPALNDELMNFPFSLRL